MSTATFRRAHLLPIIVFIWFPLTFVITYCIAVAVKDVVPIFPYISDTGTFSPESCIFGQLLNTGAILMGTVIYIRYRQVIELLTIYELANSINVLNVWCLWLGLVASFGVSVVGNFQEMNIFSVHLAGAGMAFGLGTVYQVLQTLLSLKLYPTVGSKGTNYARICLSLTCSLCSALTFIFAGVSLMEFDGNDMTKWTSAHRGYKAHVSSAVAEWITAVCTMGFILTYTDEFKQVLIIEPEIEILNAKAKQSITSISRY